MIKLFQFSGEMIDYFTSTIETIGSTHGINKLQSISLNPQNLNVKIKKI